MRANVAFRRGFLGALLFCALAGCVRVEDRREPFSKTRMVITRDTKGVKLQWNSDQGQRYAILYKDPGTPGARWRPLPGYDQVIGTGGVMTVKDPSPSTPNRDYRIQTLVPVDQKELRRSR